ncbi:recombinase RecT [Paenibacillus sp. GbtcB18]|uniref:recombinase RecT n=1 Tax=Paenibacillus sp. GbtcB18 TaxID=2824763 RepID=UPI001C2F2F8B|nr:recombinase RecT [Paenibacillus sp. GbtcB18]
MSTEKQNAVAKKELTHSERFMQKVVTEFGTSVGEVALTQFQKRLAQNYFVALDSILRSTEEKRLKKSEKYRDALPVTWANVNMDKLALDVVSLARVGFDPSQPNHINPIPFKNNNTNKYDITFIEGYRGIELKATKYGLNPPDKVIVELVYSNDKFVPLKKDAQNPIENYTFSIENPFNRGEIIGGFYYHIYVDMPEKNKLALFSLSDIEKRKPEKASPEFWGGEKDKWDKGQKVGTETVTGWPERMCWKTIFRAAYSDIAIDSQKIDDDYLRLLRLESEFSEAEVNEEISRNANRKVIDINPTPPQPEAPEENGAAADAPPEGDLQVEPDRAQAAEPPRMDPF